MSEISYRLSEISYRYWHFPPAIVHNAIWLYCRFTLSFRDVEDRLAEPGIEVSYETIRRWVAGFGPAYAKRLRNLRPKAHPQSLVTDKLRAYAAADRELGLR